jgi:hypothetical protein
VARLTLRVTPPAGAKAFETTIEASSSVFSGLLGSQTTASWSPLRGTESRGAVE